MKLQPAPDGWPKEFPYTDNHWFNAWRPRPSEATRIGGCLAFTYLPRVSDFMYAKASGVNAQVQKTVEEKLAERKAKTAKGNADHELFRLGKLKGQEDRFGPYKSHHHEVPIYYDLLKGVSTTTPTKTTNDVFRNTPQSRRYLFGTADYYDGETKLADLKTGEIKEDAVRQLAMYAHMAGADKGNHRLLVWHKRARIDKLHGPEYFGQTNESLRIATVDAISRVRRLLLTADFPEPTPGPHCSFCPSRFYCPAYVGGYTTTQIKPIRKWLLEELDAYHAQEI